MFPTAGYPQAPMAFGFPGQQTQMSLYQSQFGGIGGFTPSFAPTFQPVAPVVNPAPRGQSLPASARQYMPSAGTYVSGQTSSSRRQRQDGAYPPPVPSQNYERQSGQGSKSKKHQKRRSISPGGAGEPGLYSDKERHDQSEGQQERSRSPSPAAVSRSKHDDTSDQQQLSNTTASNVQGDGAAAPPVARSEELQATHDQERRKSGSKKKKHHRRDRQDNYNVPPTQEQPMDVNPNPAYPSAYPTQAQQPYLPQQPVFSEYQNELPPQLKVHRQPLYSGYNQAYEESIRRGDVYRKQAKRSARLPPEVKQKLLPHEDDQPTQVPPAQAYSYGTPNAPGYAQPGQPYPGIRPPFNPYQPFPNQGGYFNPNPAPAPAPYNALQPWPAIAPPVASSEQEIQRLRSHIHTLEGELHKLQRKLNKTHLNTEKNDGSEEAGQQAGEKSRSHRRSKRDEVASPRHTPVIVELNTAPPDPPVRTSSKKHRHRTASNTSSQQVSQIAPSETTPVQQRPIETSHVMAAVAQIPTAPPPAAPVAHEVREQSRPPANVSAEVDERQNKATVSKPSREETAAQLAHAAAAHVNSRQGTTAPPVQPNPVGPPPPQMVRPQFPPVQQPPPQQQQQQQFLYQQGAVRPQGPPIRGPAPPMQMPGFAQGPPPVQQPVQTGGHYPMINPNYNQSNNNELFDDAGVEVDPSNRVPQDEENRSAEKILDAFERYYLQNGKSSTAPMKVKFIPEANPKLNSSHGNMNNNNNNHQHPTVPSTSSQQHRRSQSSSSSSSSSSYSSSESIYSNSPISSRRSNYDNNLRATAAMKTGPFI